LLFLFLCIQKNRRRVWSGCNGRRHAHVFLIFWTPNPKP
jgi:hypothetical protein